MRAAPVLLCLMLLANGVHAENIYFWTGSDGKPYYGDLPPRDARDVRRFARKVGTVATLADPVPLSDQPPAMSGPDCAAKRVQLASYRTAARLVERDSLGREHEYSAAEREQLVARTAAELTTRCGDAPAP